VPDAGLPVIDVAPGEAKTIGRSSQADITIEHPSLSRLHARVSAEADGLLAIDDLGSTNGVLVNGRELMSSYLRQGDLVRLGGVEYVVARK
jgi:pSer/pThr/pTyr-binding forkhead associated (FHA) protein